MLKRRVRIVIVAAALLIVALALLWLLTLLSPAWWNPPAADDPTVRRLADDFEYRLIEQAQRHRPDGRPWAVRIEEEQVNAWLAARLPRWIEHDRQLKWPDGYGAIQLHFERGQLLLGLQLESGFRQIIGITSTPSLNDDGLSIMLDRIWIGRLPIPGTPVAYLLDRISEDESEEFLKESAIQAFIDVALHGRRIEPVIGLVDDRAVELLDFDLQSGSIVLRCRTLPARRHTESGTGAPPSDGAPASEGD